MQVSEKRKGQGRHAIHVSRNLPSASPSRKTRSRASCPLPIVAQSFMSDSASPTIGGRGYVVVAANGQSTSASLSDLPGTIAEIQELNEQRRDLIGMTVSLTNRMKALVKSKRKLKPDAKVSEKMIATTDYMPLVTLSEARAHILKHVRSLDKQLENNAKELPGYTELVLTTSGFGALGLAQIIGEAGDLRNYSMHSKLWKRMGLHVFDGRACWTKRPGMSAEQWTAAKYNPRRRSVMYTITNLGLMTKKNRYRDYRDERLKLERVKAKDECKMIVPAKKIPKGREDEFRSAGHILNRANRAAGKKLLRDLWKIWRREAMDPLPKG